MGPQPLTEAEIAAFKRERDAYLRVGKTDRAAQVDAYLALRGYRAERVDPRTVPPQGRTSRPRQTAEQGIVELRAAAEALGVRVDGRWSASRLEQEIARARSGGQA